MRTALLSTALGLGVLLTGCGPVPPSPADNYTGNAYIYEAHGSGSKAGCELYFRLPDGQTDKERLGRRSSCDGWVGRTVKLTNGRIDR